MNKSVNEATDLYFSPDLLCKLSGIRLLENGEDRLCMGFSFYPYGNILCTCIRFIQQNL